MLVGVAPAGHVSYVSPTYGGSVSDMQIVERSNLTQMVDQGDSVMADKGFDVHAMFAPCECKHSHIYLGKTNKKCQEKRS